MCDISIIIPFYNKTEMTKDCLRSIAATTPNPIADGRYTYEIVLVDDRSSEPYSFESEEKSCLALRVVRNETNLGFAGSCNRGASMANGRYLVFLNNDTLVCEGWLEEMVKAIQADPSVGMVGNKLLYPDERVQHAGFVFDEAGMPFLLYRRFPPSFSGVNKTREFQAVIGACFLIEADLFHQLGGFDEAYKNGVEDIDLCMRVREAGKKVLYCHTSCVYHLESQTRKVGLQHQVDNLKLFKDRWLGKLLLADYQKYYEADLKDEGDFSEDLRTIKKAASSPDKPVIALWGAGDGGRHAYSLLKWIGVSADFFVDSSEAKWGMTIEGCPVKGPEALSQLKKQNQPVFVVIASLWAKEIGEQLISLGFEPGKDFLVNSLT